MSYIDALILLPLLVGFVRGMMRGLISELVAILAVIMGIVGSRMWGAKFATWVAAYFTWPNEVCTVVAYTLLFLGIAIACNLLGRMFSRLIRAIHLGWLNRIMGALFGMGKWAIILMAVLLAVDTLDARFAFLQDDVKNQSVCYKPAVNAAHDCFSIARSQLGQPGTNN